MITRFNSRSLKHDCDFVALVSRYTPLRRANGQWRGLCPFHRESNPSFYVEPHKKIWKCFGCERGGDVFDFVMLTEGCDFSRALRIVAEREIATASAPRSGKRFGRSEETVGFSARPARGSHSPQSEREAILARLDATEARLVAIRAANDAAATEFATACEPSDSGMPATNSL